jgi:hypothetical protein
VKKEGRVRKIGVQGKKEVKGAIQYQQCIFNAYIPRGKRIYAYFFQKACGKGEDFFFFRLKI